MTTLTTKRALKRETAVMIQGRLLIATITPHGVELRRKNDRDGFFVPWDVVYETGCKLDARARLNTAKREFADALNERRRA